MIGGIISLIYTILSETVIGLLVLRGTKFSMLLKVVIAVNLITNPLINFTAFVVSQFIPNSYLYNPYIFGLFILLELFAILFEALMIQKYLEVSKVKALYASLLMNLFSYFSSQFFVMAYYIYGNKLFA